GRGTTRNYWGGQSNATTHLMSQMHYWGMLRVVRRDNGIRVYAARPAAPDIPLMEIDRRLDALVDVAVGLYAPLPAPDLRRLIHSLRYAVPQWRGELAGALRRSQERLSRAHAGGVDWFWPRRERLPRSAAPDSVRLLAPFDPVVAHRERFERL